MALITDKSRKWLIAICMSFLMVAFALPSWVGQNGRTRADRTYGTVYGTEKLTEREVEYAREEWKMLASPLGESGSGFSVATRLFMGDINQYLSQMELFRAFDTARRGVAEISRNPAQFAILKREAIKAGITVNPQRVEEILTTYFRLPPETKTPMAEQLRQAVSSLVLVETYGQQCSYAAKVTQPELDSNMAQVLQSLRLAVTVIEAPEFRLQVPPPTDAQAKALFEQFKERYADDPQFDTNPFGFGYRQGDRIRFDYLSLPRAEILRAARESQSEYDWEVAAQKYYVQNQQIYLSDAPATKPSDPLSLGSGGAAPSTQKSLKPFTEVKNQILTTLYENRADQLTQQVQRRVTALLAGDYRAYADAISRKTAPPATAVGQPIESFEYLRAIAAKVEQELKVRLAVTTFADRYFDEAALSKTAGIGQATLQSPPQANQRPIPFGRYVLARARTLFDAPGAAHEAGAIPLENLEPTPAFVDEGENIYIARVTDAKPSRVPTYEEVVATVREDVIISESQERAKSAGSALSSADPSTPLMEAAAKTSRKAFVIPALQQSTSSIPELSLSPVSRVVFMKEAFDLLRADLSVQHPRAVINLPRDRKVAVVELLDVTSVVPGADLASIKVQALHQMRLQRQTEFLAKFYQKDAVASRTGFALDPAFAKDAPASPAAPAAPAGNPEPPLGG